MEIEKNLTFNNVYDDKLGRQKSCLDDSDFDFPPNIYMFAGI